jgi:6-phosphogluconolactonase
MTSGNGERKPHRASRRESSPPLKVEVHHDAAVVARCAAALIAEAARQAIGQRDRFVLALSGGNTPQQMLRFLAAEAIDWQKVHVVQVDERVAPTGSSDRNLTQLREILLTRASIPAEQIHAMPVDCLDLAAAAAGYGHLLTSLAGSPPLLDLVHLGLGTDGHTASLVSGAAAVEVHSADVAITETYRGWRRMTLTFPIINRARRILWLVTGEDKAEVVARLARCDHSLLASRISRAQALLLTDQRDTYSSQPRRSE